MKTAISTLLLAVAALGWGEVGLASWYGFEFHGRLTANGEVYDMHALTAAHLTLPFGTVVRVTNLSNERSVQLRINDRGPYVDDRIIDLSLAGAQALGMMRTGLAHVSIEVVAEAPQPRWVVQVGAYGDHTNAVRVHDALQAAGLVVSLELATTATRVLVGVITDSELEGTLVAIRAAGFGDPLPRRVADVVAEPAAPD